MRSGGLVFGTSLAVMLLRPPFPLLGQDTKPAPPEKPTTAPKEVLLRGTLTAREQEVTHVVALRKDQNYLITTDSRGFFTHVEIEDESGNMLMPPSAAVSYKATYEGPFRLIVSSPGGSSGQYVISVRPVSPNPAVGEILTIGPEGLSVEGILSKEDPLDKVRKKHCRIYDVRMSGGKTYVIDLMSKQFDAFLRVENAAGKQLAQDDDSGGANNARIRYQAPADGVYRIFATSFGLETGLFHLRVKQE